MLSLWDRHPLSEQQRGEKLPVSRCISLLRPVGIRHPCVGAPFVLLPARLPACVPAGQVCLFDCIEWLREQLQQWQDEAAAADLAGSVGQLALSSSRAGSNAGSSDAEEWPPDGEEWDPDLQHLPEASTSRGVGASLCTVRRGARSLFSMSNERVQQAPVMCSPD